VSTSWYSSNPSKEPKSTTFSLHTRWRMTVLLEDNHFPLLLPSPSSTINPTEILCQTLREEEMKVNQNDTTMYNDVQGCTTITHQKRGGRDSVNNENRGRGKVFHSFDL
jgi:hypothetical protein